eukprot:TRINITY_DN915_c0_g1_i1.p1 TRINITY_DN915_c0_g1~~TRINITY_DN915_c0_g1_i1.p1  ORF type:complete len:314 (+),score=51.76 TRINITY_DN915_c0_g1_i1:47-943(+)
MGKDRNLLPTQKQSRDTHFSDPDVCKNYICGFCPSELFTNTKSDLGPCTKNHDENVKKQYQEVKNKSQYPYERDFIHHLERLIEDLDRKVKRGRERLETQEGGDGTPLLPADTVERVKQLDARIVSLMEQAEALGEEGKVDESQAVLRQIDAAKIEKQRVVQEGENRLNQGQEKRMRVCEICGAFLVVGDTEKRISSHLEGKQHQGYDLIRKALADHRANFKDEPRRDDRRSMDNGRRRDFDRGREYRDRDRDGGRDYRDRDRSPHRDRDRRDHNYNRNRDRRPYERDRSRSPRRDRY